MFFFIKVRQFSNSFFLNDPNTLLRSMGSNRSINESYSDLAGLGWLGIDVLIV